MVLVWSRDQAMGIGGWAISLRQVIIDAVEACDIQFNGQLYQRAGLNWR